jgi:hypothetical protein
MSLFATKSVKSIIAESEGAEVKLKHTLGPCLIEDGQPGAPSIEGIP